jgi:hypothetical protein
MFILERLLDQRGYVRVVFGDFIYFLFMDIKNEQLIVN